MEDDFGDRMKELEQAEAGRRFLPLLPILARIDGKCFHSYTQRLNRPYDDNFCMLMVETTKFLVSKTQAKIGYTQSDEISLVYYSDSYDSQVFFDRKIQKMTSVLASMATAYFNMRALHCLPSFSDDGLPVEWDENCGASRPPAFFDCRVWVVPTKTEAANAILWRELDASKNSMSMAARSKFSHAELANKTGPQMQEMLFSKHGINWNDYPAFFKRGSYVRTRRVLRELTAEEMANIPEKFRPKPGDKILRSEVATMEMPQFAKIANREGVIFDGEDPQVSEKA